MRKKVSKHIRPKSIATRDYGPRGGQFLMSSGAITKSVEETMVAGS